MRNISYKKFISSSFFKELQTDNRTTEEFVNFVLSFIGIDNFVKNHPKPIIEYYWKTNHGNDALIEGLAEKYGVILKPIACGIADINNKLTHLSLRYSEYSLAQIGRSKVPQSRQEKYQACAQVSTITQLFLQGRTHHYNTSYQNYLAILSI